LTFGSETIRPLIPWYTLPAEVKIPNVSDWHSLTSVLDVLEALWQPHHLA
jgi:hypothetical protein